MEADNFIPKDLVWCPWLFAQQASTLETRAATRKRRPPTNEQISNTTRAEIIRRVIDNKESLVQVSKSLKVKYSTAYTIIGIYRKQGRVEKLCHRKRTRKAFKVRKFEKRTEETQEIPIKSEEDGYRIKQEEDGRLIKQEQEEDPKVEYGCEHGNKTGLCLGEQDLKMVVRPRADEKIDSAKLAKLGTPNPVDLLKTWRYLNIRRSRVNMHSTSNQYIKMPYPRVGNIQQLSGIIQNNNNSFQKTFSNAFQEYTLPWKMTQRVGNQEDFAQAQHQAVFFPRSYY